MIVSRGPEYDAMFSEVTVRRGQEFHLPVTLVRSVHTHPVGLARTSTAIPPPLETTHRVNWEEY